MNQTPLCAALLSGSELGRLASYGPAAEVSEATRGSRGAVVLVKWRPTGDYEPVDDPRLQLPLVYRDQVTFAVQPRRDGADGMFAVMAGPRRSLVGEARRLEDEFGIGRVRFQVLKRAPVKLTVPNSVTAPASDYDLRLAGIIYDTPQVPGVAFYDVPTGEVFYPVPNHVLDAIEDDELRAYGVVTGNADSFRTWYRHEVRKGEPMSLIRFERYALLSYPAFQVLRDLTSRAGRADRAPSSFLLEAALSECLGAACHKDPPAPAVRPSPVQTLPAPVDPGGLPSRQDLRVQISRVPPLTDSIVRKLLALGHGTEVDSREVLDRDNSLAEIFNRLWAHYFPGERPKHTMRQRDGTKLLRAGVKAEHQKTRLDKAWLEFKSRVRAD